VSTNAPTELEPLLPGVFVWMSPTPSQGHTNAGVVIDTDGLTIVDTLAVPSQWQEFGQAVTDLGWPVPRVVLTSSHIQYSGGSRYFRSSAVYGTAEASEALDQPANPALFQRLFPELASEFDDTTQTRPVTHVVAEEAYLSAATLAVPTAGQMLENLVLAVPGEGLVFAGAMCSFGVTPMAYDGDLARWADELELILDLGQIIVPGHGPIGGEEEVRDLQGYLRACVDAEGNPDALADGPWVDWTDRHWDAINIERAAMISEGNYSPPQNLLKLLGLTS